MPQACLTGRVVMADEDRERAVDRFFGARMCARRVETGLSQDDVALVIDATLEDIEAFEHGDKCPTPEQVSDIADCLGVPIRYFYE